MTLPREDRDAALDALLEAFNAALEAERKRVNRQIALLKSMVEGRDLGALEDNVTTTLGARAVDDLALFTEG